MKQQSSLARLWSYLKAYRFSVFFAVFLKIVSVIMSVIEPFVLGLAITELTSTSLPWQMVLQEQVLILAISQ